MGRVVVKVKVMGWKSGGESESDVWGAWWWWWCRCWVGRVVVVKVKVRWVERVVVNVTGGESSGGGGDGVG